jgi:hypothetical protein
MGESKQRAMVVREQMVEALGLETASGPLKVRWDGKAQSSILGQMAFFIEFLTVTGLFDQWVADCPLNYKSSQWIEPPRPIGDVDAFDIVWALALRARKRDRCRWGQSGAFGDERSGGGRHTTAGA